MPPSHLRPSGASASLRAIVLTVLTATVFAVMNGINKYLTLDYHVGQVIWARFFFAQCAILLVAGYRGQIPELFRTRRPKLQAVRTVMMLFSTLLFIGALSLLPLADVEAINFAAPLCVVALSAPILRERVPGAIWAAVIIGFIGILVIIRPGAGVWSWAALMPLGVALMYAVFQLVTRRVGNADPALTSLFLSGLLGMVATTLAVPLFWKWPDAQGWTLMILSGAFGSLGHFLLIKALDLAPASLLQPFTYVQLLVAIAIGYFVFGALPDLWTWIGGTIVVASGLYVLMYQRRPKPADS